jgi:hypothetical protein
VQWVTRRRVGARAVPQPTRTARLAGVELLLPAVPRGTSSRRLGDGPQVTIRRGREVTGSSRTAMGSRWRTRGLRAMDESTCYLKARAQLVESRASAIRRLRRWPQHDPQRTGHRRWRQRASRSAGWCSTSRPPTGRAVRHLPYFDFVCDPELPTVSCPQPDGRHRFEFMLRTATSPRSSSPRDAPTAAQPYVDVDEVEITGNSSTRSTRWSPIGGARGACLLAGDAAHMTPQFIGQGMNAGRARRRQPVLEARRRSCVTAPPRRCSTPTRAERKPHAKAMIDLSVFNKDIVSTQQRVRDPGA